MWARVVEIVLACWLAISPFVFRHPAGARGLWLNDLLCALVVLISASLSFWKRTPWAHALVGLVGGWLVAWGRLSADHPAPPAFQNHIVTGLLLLMLAIVPNEGDPRREAL